MGAYRLTRRESPKGATAVLQSLERACAIPCGLRLALAHLGSSEPVNIGLTKYQPGWGSYFNSISYLRARKASMRSSNGGWLINRRAKPLALP